MKHCCSSNCDNTSPKKYHCPTCLTEHPEVSIQTIIHHIKKPWNWRATAKHYYFCDTPTCDVAYFGRDDSVISKFQLRTYTGENTHAPDEVLCYCFGIRKSDIRKEPLIKRFVIEQTKKGVCSCKTHNPSGRCCLKYFPKI